uniref:myotubularin-related protein 3-like isoform X4 n=1 Tax=Myxine glutinosa TaxID=7769 RepID=UPI00358EB7DD
MLTTYDQSVYSAKATPDDNHIKLVSRSLQQDQITCYPQSRLVASTVEGWSNCQRPLAGMVEAERGGMEYIQASELFPKKALEREDEILQVPFTEVHGEAVEYLGRADDAVIAISNYRLHIKYTDSVVNIPLRLIETVECRDMFQLYIACKDCKVVRCQFQTMEQCQEWGKRLVMACATPARLEDLFAFAYHAWCLESPCGHTHGELYRPGEHITMRFENEVERMSFDMQDAWRISTINMNYRFCSSYPQRLIVPAWITDKELESVASFRTSKRIPTVVYRHGSNGAVIARSSQPEVSWWGWRNADDEHLVRAISKSCAQDCGDQPQLNGGGDLSLGSECSDFDASLASPAQTDSAARPVPKLLILDARSYPAAIANRAKGGGCECPEYYPNCEIYFMGMANIHSIRKSFQALRALCTQAPDPSNWLSGLESTRWLQHLSLLLKAGGLVATTLSRDARSVLVHCSDGWDRTPQVVALAKLLLDPYYRTIEGFQLLVETEWLDFGHKFGERCGHGVGAGDANERCPVFLQWLDAVHQLLRQFPCSFEFNEAFLVKLVQHSHSCLYGTFLCNTPRERDENRSLERTCSIWSLLRPVSSSFHNLLYSAGSDMVLHPVCHVRSLLLWSGVYLPSFSPAPPTEDNSSAYPLPSEEVLPGRLPKTRSFDDLPAACDMNTPPLTRRSSDPNINDLLPERRRSIDGVNMYLQAEPGISAILHREPVMQTLSPSPNGLMHAVPASLTAEQISPHPDVVEHVDGLDLRRGQVSKEEILDERGLNNEESVVEFKRHSEVSVPPHLTSIEEFSGTLENQNLLWQQLPGITTPSQKGPERPLHVKSDNNTVLEETCQMNDEDIIADGQAPGPLVVLRLQDKSSTALESSTETLTEDNTRTEPDYTRAVNGDGGTYSLGGYDTGGITTSASSTFSPLNGDHHPATETPVAISSCSRAAGNHTSSTSASESRLYRSHKVRCSKVNGVTREGENGPENREMLLRGCRVGIGCIGCRPCALCARTDTPSSTESCQVVPTLRQTATSLRWSPPPGTFPGVTRCAAEDDGLPLHIDAVQARLRQMEAGHRHELMELQLQVQRLRVQVGHCGHREAAPTQHDDVNCAPECEGNPDYSSLSQCSTEQNSENSWEQVDRLDTEVTRWVPDHVANSCFSCESKFWTVNRKHHCRNCGNVFCWNCCSQKVPVPSQQLYDPARVCKACYRYLIPSDGGRPLEFSALLDS